MKASIPSELFNGGLVRGSIVRSMAGHDRHEIFIVLEVADGFVRLADGGSRRHDTPKRKRVLHVRSLGCLPDPSALDRIDALGDTGQRDAALRKLLKEYKVLHDTSTISVKEET